MAAAFEELDANDELWRECVTWLINWEMLRPDHKANWPTACIADLANILRDGVLLCKLLNKIIPGCIDMKDVNLKPTMAQFLCLRNINLFLKTCEDTFGLKPLDLFDDTMLFDLTNFHKVLCTLSKLSLSPKVLKLGKCRGFVVQREEEVIYDDLQKVDIRCNSGLNCSDPSWLQFKIPCPQPEDWEEEVYDDLCYVTFSSSLPQMPARERGLVEPDCDFDMTSEEIYQDLCLHRASVEQPPSFEKRDFVIKELLDTENNYVDVLKKLLKNFMLPLVNQMKSQEHQVVFFKIRELFEIHSEFLHELSKVRNDPTAKLSNIFMRWREKFLVYGMYCANLTKATTILQELCDTDEIFNQTVIKYEKEDNNGRFKLRDVLSVPMQRILKYHLLLDKLIENTDPNHEEYNELQRAREAMLDVAGYINESARDSDHLEVINKLQETITEWDLGSNQKLSDYGRLIKDAELRIQPHDATKSQNRYVFIFDKCILICKQLKGNQFAFRNLLNIADYYVDNVHNRAVLNKETRWSYHFNLVKNDRKNVYTIFVKSKELKEQIIKAINDALDNLHPKTLQRTSHNFELNTFTSPVQCLHCSKYLKGLIYQGYKCNTCNIAVHKGCIQYSGRCGQTFSYKSCLTNGTNVDPMKEKLWFVGEMDRDTARAKLDRREKGTYLVRIRPQNDEKGKYALSLKTENIPKHMKICCTNELPCDSKKYYLSQSRFFNSIEELVLHYQVYSLRENFERLEEDARLLWPYRQLRATVLRSYDAQDQFQLSLVEGETVIIVEKEGYREGWWKARTENNETGFVPLSILRIEGEVKFEV